MFTSLELSITFFLIYIAIAVVIGIVSSRKESEEDFMIANRKVAGVQMIATVTAGFFDGAALAVYIAYVYIFGFSAIWFFIGIAVGFLLFAHLVGRIKRNADRMKVYSMPEYFYKLFGKRNGLMFSIFLVLQFFLFLVLDLIISGKVLVSIFPIPYWLAVLIGGSIILTYLLLAGFKAVVKTDFYQLIIMLVMTFTVAVVLFGKTDFTQTNLNIMSIGAGNIIGFLIIAGFGIMVAPDLWQRVFAAKDEKTIKRGFRYGALILPILAVVITIVGLATKQYFPALAPEDALVTGFAALLPFGMREFGLVLLYAVALSSSDTVTFVISSIFTRDLKNYTKKFNDESMRNMTRSWMIILVFVAALIAITYQNILQLAFSLAGLNLALFPVVFGSLFWRLKERAVFWSLVITLLFVLGMAITSTLTPETTALALPVALLSLLVLQQIKK